MSPFKVVRDFEQALCEYTGAPFAVTTTSCTMALLLAVACYWRERDLKLKRMLLLADSTDCQIEIPKRTYIGVPMAIVHAGGRPIFRDENWKGAYQLKPLPVWDCARIFTRGMYYQVAGVAHGQMHCVSFHWNKTLGIQQGGAILHDNAEADRWLRKARFDGRTEGVPPAHDTFDVLGWHAYMAPETAAAGLVRLASLPAVNPPLPNDPYPDLSEIELFR